MARKITTSKPLLTSLTGLRAVAALWVVGEHFRSAIFSLVPYARHAGSVIASGFLGVEVFFVLSGFIISYGYASKFAKFNRRSYFEFSALRLARIYPVHVVTLCLMAFLLAAASILHVDINFPGKYHLGNFVANMFLLQAVPPFDSWNVPAWSISAEFGAYLIFPMIALLLARIRTPRLAFIWSAVVCLVRLATIILVSYLANDPTTKTSYAQIWLRIGTEFITGCLLHTGWKLSGRHQFGRLWDWIGLGSVGATILILSMINSTTYVAFAVLPFLALFVLCCAGATDWLARLLSLRLMQWGGRISYSVYMTHFIIFMLIGKLVPRSRFQGRTPLIGILLLGAYFAVIVAAGAAVYYLVEEPARVWLRGRIGPSKDKLVGSPPDVASGITS